MTKIPHISNALSAEGNANQEQHWIHGTPGHWKKGEVWIIVYKYYWLIIVEAQQGQRVETGSAMTSASKAGGKGSEGPKAWICHWWWPGTQLLEALICSSVSQLPNCISSQEFLIQTPKDLAPVIHNKLLPPLSLCLPRQNGPLVPQSWEKGFAFPAWLYSPHLLPPPFPFSCLPTAHDGAVMVWWLPFLAWAPVFL